MDVNKADRRELELANRLLRERENQHAREIESLQDGQREQVQALKQTQKENIDRIRADASDSATNQRDRFENEIEKTGDSYRKSLEEERAESYDKFGRLSSESNRQLTREKEIAAKQLQQITDMNDHEVKGQTDQHRASIDKLQKQFTDDSEETQKRYEKTLHDRNMGNQDAMTKQAGNFREEVDSQIRKNSDELIRSKAQNDALLKKLTEDSEIERQRLVGSAKLRESQLGADKTYLQKDLIQKGAKSMEEFRERAAETIGSTIREANETTNQANRAEAKRYSNLNQEFNAKLQNRDNIARDVEAELMFQNRQERDRNDLHNQITENRHKQDMYLASEAVAENNKLSGNEIKMQYADNLHDLDQKNRVRNEDLESSMQKKMFEMEMRNSGDRAATLKDRDRDIAKLALANRREKSEVIRAYESRQAMADEQRARQYNDAKAALDRDIRYVRENADRSITASNRNNQIQIFEKQQTLLNRTEELENQRKTELEAKDQIHGDRVKRLTDTYNRTLMANKDAFDDESDTLRHEDTLLMTKMRGDLEHEKRVQLMDLLNKSRAAMSMVETRFNTQKDEFDEELAKSKADHDKTLRETVRKARETVDLERTLHQREIEAKDLQTKEKMRLQEEAFRDNIEKLKRSYELSLKKS